MKKKTKEFESKKVRLFHILLQIIAGGVLVWCLLWFLPLDSFFNFTHGLFGNYSNDVGITAALTIIVALSFLVFAFGYYCIQWCLNLGTSSKNEEQPKVEKTRAKKEAKPTV